jgi:hypothetical protein
MASFVTFEFLRVSAVGLAFFPRRALQRVLVLDTPGYVTLFQPDPRLFDVGIGVPAENTARSFHAREGLHRYMEIPITSFYTTRHLRDGRRGMEST